MRPPIHFHFVLHDHQPFGNFPEVFETAWESAYGPTLRLLERYPFFRFGLHITGALWEWIEAHRPAAIDLIGAMVERGQIELIGGPFYEPVLALIPRGDAVAQLRLMSEYLRRRFGQSPRGAWLAERVWQPDLPEILEQAGAAFTFVDDTHLFTAGPTGDDVADYVLTESRGCRVALFPIDFRLRYTIPFEEPEKTVGRLLELREKGFLAATYADDGEKLGLWPGTAGWVWEKKWMERFLVAIERAPGVELALPGETLEAIRPSSLAYLPTTSYDELGEWALPPVRQRQRRRVLECLEGAEIGVDPRVLVRGGHFSVFLARYPEANLLHKRMLGVSRRLEGAWSQEGLASDDPLPMADAGDGNGSVIPALARARRALFRAQVNCPYWHGLFGGLYMPVLRHVVPLQLLEAERALAEAGHPPGPRPQIADLDCDGYGEILGGEGPGRYLLSERFAGGLREWGLWGAKQAPLDVMARRRESYHAVTAESPCEPGASVDGNPKPRSIHDLHECIPPELLERAGWDVAPRVSAVELRFPAGLSLERHRLGGPWRDEQLRPWRTALGEDGALDMQPLEAGLGLHRRIRFSPDGTEAVFEHHAGNLAPDQEWAVEWNLALPGQGSVVADGRTLLALDGEMVDPISAPSVSDVVVYTANPGLRLDFSIEPKARLGIYLVETILRSESGFEGVIQGVCMLLTAPRDAARLEIGVKLSPDRS